MNTWATQIGLAGLKEKTCDTELGDQGKVTEKQFTVERKVNWERGVCGIMNKDIVQSL